MSDRDRRADEPEQMMLFALEATPSRPPSASQVHSGHHGHHGHHGAPAAVPPAWLQGEELEPDPVCTPEFCDHARQVDERERGHGSD